MEGMEDNPFQMDSFVRYDNNFGDYSPKKVLENLGEDMPVIFDSSFNKNSTDDNASDYQHFLLFP